MAKDPKQARAQSEVEGSSPERPFKKSKTATEKDTNVEPQDSADTKGNGRGKGTPGAAAQTWTQRLGKKGEATSDAGVQGARREPSIPLLSKAYGTDAVLQVSELRSSLEAGKMPTKRSAVLCTESSFVDFCPGFCSCKGSKMH